MSRANPRFRRSNQRLSTPVNNVYRVKMVGSIEGQLTINVLYYTDQNGVATANPTHQSNLFAALSLANGVNAKYAACMSSDWTFTQVVIDCPTSPSLAPYLVVGGTAGTGPSGHEPTEVAFPLIKYTAVKGQCGRGRISFPAVPTTWVTASKVSNTTAHTAFGNIAIAVIAGGGDTFTPVLYSRNGSRAFPGAGVAPLIGVYSLNSLLGTVRRRKIGRGK